MGTSLRNIRIMVRYVNNRADIHVISQKSASKENVCTHTNSPLRVY